MFVRKAFQYRLRPTKAGAKLPQAQLDECRWLYNELLSQRKIAHEELDISLSKYQQLMFLPLLKEERPALNLVVLNKNSCGNFYVKAAEIADRKFSRIA